MRKNSFFSSLNFCGQIVYVTLIFFHRKFEEFLGRPLMRLCCFMHMVELPARRLATKLIGDRLGPASRHGEVGALLSQQVELMPLVEFKVIENPDFFKGILYIL